MENKETGKVGFFGGIGILIKNELARRRDEPGAVIFDISVFVVAFLFSRCHIAFSAYPLGISFVAMLPRGVWISLIGVVAGSLSLGRSGIIHAIISLIVVFLRVVISGGEDRGAGKTIFHEALVLKLAAAVIGAFIGATYEVLLGGFSFRSVMYGVFSVLMTLAFTFAFSGIIDGGVSFSDILTSRARLFSGRGEKERFGAYIFQGSSLLFVFLIALSLKQYDILGISPSYIFASFITLTVAKRLGALRGMAVGFVSCLAVSSLYSAAFALVGLTAGLLFSGGLGFALVGAGIILSLWGFYAGGVTGFLSLFPEYVTAALLTLPMLKKLPSAAVESIEEEKQNTDAADMVRTCAAAYRGTVFDGGEALPAALLGISASLRGFGIGEGEVSKEEYRDIAIESTKEFCKGCHYYSTCVIENPAPCVENIDIIATKLYNNEKLLASDSAIAPRYCHSCTALFSEVSRNAADYEKAKYKTKKLESLSKLYELHSRLISECTTAQEKAARQDKELSEKLLGVFIDSGLSGADVRVYGERKKHIIAAAHDRDGHIISSKKLKSDIEEALGLILDRQEFYRKGDAALFECSSLPMYSIDFSAAGAPISNAEPSGDTAVSFESDDGKFYSLISDGMGSGEPARRTSSFCADFLSSILNSSASKSTAFHILNHIVRSGEEECSATVDLFEFDLYTGDAVFYKCGAAASYVKRDNSIFRIRSETAPIGLMKNIDAERVRVEVKSGDYIVMISDGVSQSPEDATWLLEFLNKPATPDVREYADEILALAKDNSKLCDDISVSVLRVLAV